MSVFEPFHERRIAPRADVRYPVVLTERTETASVECDYEVLSPLFGEALNLSETGALVEVDEPICLGRTVVVTVELRGRNVAIEGRVARTTRVRGTKRIRIGVRWTGLETSARALLRSEIARQARTCVLN